MPEPDFAALREELDRDIHQPEFRAIRAIRRRRSARWAVAGAVVAVLAVLAGTVWAVGYPRPDHHPVVGPTGTPGPGPSASGAAPQSPAAQVGALAFAPSGTLFLLADRCPFDCPGTGGTPGRRLLRSDDSGASWTTLAGPPGLGGGTLLAASDTELWLVDDVTVHHSTDGGHSWQSLSLAGDNPDEAGYAGLAGDTVWLAQNGEVAVAAGGGQPAATPSHPPGAPAIDGLAALGADRAAVLTGTDNATWYVTSDRGAHWTAMADPCTGTRYPHSRSATLSPAPDGGLWAVCAAEPAAGQQDKQLVTSADGGRTWLARGPLEPAGYGTRVIPISATVAWRTGPRADLYRTSDATRWSRVAVTGDAAGGDTPFAARDADTAAYAQADTVTVTHDGGRTWEHHPLPPD